MWVGLHLHVLHCPLFLLLIQVFTFPGPSIRCGDKALLWIYSGNSLGSLYRKQSEPDNPELKTLPSPSLPSHGFCPQPRSYGCTREAREARLSAHQLPGRCNLWKIRIVSFYFSKINMLKNTLFFNIGKTYLRFKIQRIQRYTVKSLSPIPGTKPPGRQPLSPVKWQFGVAGESLRQYVVGLGFVIKTGVVNSTRQALHLFCALHSTLETLYASVQ